MISAVESNPPHAECHSSQEPFILFPWVKSWISNGFSNVVDECNDLAQQSERLEKYLEMPRHSQEAKPGGTDGQDRDRADPRERGRTGRCDSIQYMVQWTHPQEDQRSPQRTHMCTGGGTLSIRSSK